MKKITHTIKASCKTFRQSAYSKKNHHVTPHNLHAPPTTQTQVYYLDLSTRMIPEVIREKKKREEIEKTKKIQNWWKFLIIANSNQNYYESISDNYFPSYVL